MSDQEIAAEVLEKAADILETQGWRQDNYTDGEKVCAVGAIRIAAGGKIFEYQTVPNTYGIDGWDMEKADLAVRAFVAHVFASPVGYIPHWNDHPRRTAAEVIDTFKEAAKDLRNQTVPDA